MNILVISAGKPSLSYAKDGVRFYLDRLAPFGKTELKFVKDGRSEEVSERLLAASENCVRIAMDERGERWDTARFADHMRKWQLHSVKRVSFLIGASDGHTQSLRDQCDLVLSLSSLTLQHELALVVLLEQLYRVKTILAGAPYHR